MTTTNRISLIGNATKEATIKTFENRNRVANLTLATNQRGFTTKSGKEIPDKVDFHNLVIRGGLVNIVEKYIEKGSKMCVVGSLHYRDYEKDGQKHRVAEIVVSGIELLGKRSGQQDQSAAESENVVQKVVYTSQEEEDDLPF